MPGPEAILSDAIRKVLAHHGVPCWCTSTFRVRGPTGVTPGFSDLVILSELRGIWFVELKHGRNTLSASQCAFQSAVEKAGGNFLVWRTIEDCVKWIAEED